MANALTKVLAAGLKSMSLPMGSSIANGRAGLGRNWFFNGLLPGAHVDYQRKAGDAWKNSIVAASLGWISRNAPQAPWAVFRENADGEEEIVPKHDLTQKLKRPNKYYDGRTLRQATFLSLIAGRGNAYWWVKRDRIGRALEFWWLPHWECWPLWDSESTTDNWIHGYGYRNNGITYILKEEEVIHFRDGLDPEAPRFGLDPLRPVARELVVDNEAAGFAAQLLGNMCIPGCVISPDGDGTITQPEADDIKQHIEEDFGGDNRFRPMVMPSSIKIDKLSFSPEEMALHTMQDRPEARICAQIGISPMVLGLTVGLQNSTYSNMEEAERAAWYNCVIPRLMLMESEIDTQVLAFYPDSEGCRVGHDLSNVPALRENQNDLYKALSLAVGGAAFMSPNEVRAELSLKPMAGKDDLPEPVAPAAGPGGKPGDSAKSFDTEAAIRKAIGSSWQV